MMQRMELCANRRQSIRIWLFVISIVCVGSVGRAGTRNQSVPRSTRQEFAVEPTSSSAGVPPRKRASDATPSTAKGDEPAQQTQRSDEGESTDAANVISSDDLFAAAANVLEQRCLECHHGDEAEGDLSLEGDGVRKRPDLFSADQPLTSRLLEMVRPDGGVAEMPKDRSPLTADELQRLEAWFAAGAPWPAGRRLHPPQLADTDWWSLQPLRRPAIPPTSRKFDAAMVNPVDAFIGARLAAASLTPSPEADRATLIRRLTYDLHGLPPTPDEIRAFETEPGPDAYERLVDRLLASPRYGERWARHWLDVVHYGETHGYDKDKPRWNAWPYRDYVIRSLNADTPYRQFVREQLAGDILWPDLPAAIEATGFIAAGPWDFIGHAEVPEDKIDGQVARNLDRDDMVTSTMNTFCSVTVQCARCHDHKFDPVSQEHYYGLQAVFAALDRADREYDRDRFIGAQRKELERQVKQTEQAIARVDQQMDQLWRESPLGRRRCRNSPFPIIRRRDTTVRSRTSQVM